MPPKVTVQLAPAHLLSSETSAARMAKAALPDLRNPEISESRKEIGLIVKRAKELTGFDLDEFATAVGRDPRQVARWLTGIERAQFDALRSHDLVWRCTLLAIAERSGERVRVRTIVEVA